MDKVVNAILIHEDDNVVTVTRPISRGGIVEYRNEGRTERLEAVDDIPMFHKVAVADIEENGHVYKYGQLIGEAITSIGRGMHVHDHNIKSPVK